MKRKPLTKYRRAIVAVVLTTALLCACSHKGIHMQKHRKSRHCNCPTFSQNIDHPTPADHAYYGQ